VIHLCSSRSIGSRLVRGEIHAIVTFLFISRP
jgi:hypothetical protein